MLGPEARRPTHSNDTQMLVLTVLANGPLHGYAINTAIEDLTGRKLSGDRQGRYRRRGDEAAAR